MCPLAPSAGHPALPAIEGEDLCGHPQEHNLSYRKSTLSIAQIMFGGRLKKWVHEFLELEAHSAGDARIAWLPSAGLIPT